MGSCSPARSECQKAVTIYQARVIYPNLDRIGPVRPRRIPDAEPDPGPVLTSRIDLSGGRRSNSELPESSGMRDDNSVRRDDDACLDTVKIFIPIQTSHLGDLRHCDPGHT